MRQNNTWIFIILSCVAFLVFLLDLFIGSVHISFQQIISILFHVNNNDDGAAVIILQSRLPKAITAIVVGAALPVAGLMMQTFFRNPVAGPDILGVSAGASLFVAISMLGAGTLFSINILNSFSIIISAIAGAIFILVIILFVAAKIRDSISLLIFGILFGMAISSVVSILQYYSEQGALKLFILWTFGSLQGVTWQQLYILLPIVLVAILFSLFNAKKMNLLLVGEQYALSLGLHVKKTKIYLIVLTSILTGAITAFCGPIAFIGIAVPHIARLVFKTNDHFILIPGSIICGIIILLICDIISQTPGAGGVLPLNSITALMGAPFIIYILLQNNKINRYFS